MLGVLSSVPCESVQVTLIHLEDRPGPGALDIILELREQGKLCVMMLTGDHKSCAMRVAMLLESVKFIAA